MSKTLYLCDRKACAKCNSECRHTDGISHAKNFAVEIDGSYWEQERGATILRPNVRLSKKKINEIRDDIARQLQLNQGFFVVPSCMDVIKGE